MKQWIIPRATGSGKRIDLLAFETIGAQRRWQSYPTVIAMGRLAALAFMGFMMGCSACASLQNMHGQEAGGGTC